METLVARILTWHGRLALAAAVWLLGAYAAMPGAPNRAMPPSPAMTSVVRSVLTSVAPPALMSVSPSALTPVFLPAFDSVNAHQRLVLSISEFHAAWQRAWREAENLRATTGNGASQRRIRTPLIHCHPTERDSQSITTYWYSGNDVAIRRDFQFTQIRSRNSSFAACATWLFAEPVPEAQDERFGRDAALVEDMRAPMRDARALLLAELDAAATLWPGDGWIAGQRVRFWFDQVDPPSALAAANACAGSPWWCAALRGYARARRSENSFAEAAFADMRRAMTAEQHCEWDDARDLLPANERKSYSGLNCGARQAATEKLWWLADPLFRVAGNDRRLEHDVRRVELALHTALEQDERYTWDERLGGDALSTLLMRFGWPGYTGWGGDSIDDDHSDYLETRKSPRVSPYTTFEYSIDRVHTVPDWKAVTAPFAAAENSWSLSPDDYYGQPYTEWWPPEHFRPARRLVQLPEGQHALFRRDSSIRVAATITLNHALLRDGSPMDAVMVSSPAAERVINIARRSIRAGTVGVLQGDISAVPTIIGIEALGTGTKRVDARARFGIIPPATLQAMRAGDIAISDPVLLDAQDGALNVDAPTDALLEEILNTVHLDLRHRRVGVYWETYGINATDTVTVSVTVATDQQLSAMRRLGMALNVAENPNSAVVQRWVEPDVNHAIRVQPGRVPVASRALLLNLGLLQVGAYVLEVSVERRDGKVATGRRRITIER